MTEYQTEKLIASAIALLACFPLAGIALAIWFGDPIWLWLCLPLVIFLS